MWNARGSRLADRPLLDGIPDDLSPILSELGSTLLAEHGCWAPLWRPERLASGHDPDGSAPFCRALRMVRD